MELKEKLGILFSSVALIIAIASFSLSFLVYQRDGKEDLLIKLTPHHHGYESGVIQGYGTDYPAMIPFMWDCLIVNNGRIPITISKTKTIQVSPGFPLDHPRVSSAFLDDQQEVVSIPMTLQPGESKVIFFSTTILLTPEIYNLIKDEYPIGSKVLSHKLKSHLAKKGVDYYGNKVKQTIYPGGGQTIEYPSKVSRWNQQVFVLNVTTTRNKEFSFMFSEYQQLIN